MYIVGVQGKGKSALIQNMIAHDIRQDRALIAFDPHGEINVNAIAQLPPNKVAKTYRLDMEDEGYPFGANVFDIPKNSTAVAQAQSIDRVMHSFDAIWNDVSLQLYIPLYVRATTVTLFANPGSTLKDMYRLLTDDYYRHQCLQVVTDHTTLQFWKSYDALSAHDRSATDLPLKNRLESLFMGRSLVRNIVGQAKSTWILVRLSRIRRLSLLGCQLKHCPKMPG